MKKLLYFSIGTLIAANLLFVVHQIQKEAYVTSSHAVSLEESQSEDLKPLVSVTIADQPVESNDLAATPTPTSDFTDYYPNLTIKGKNLENRLSIIQNILLTLPAEKLSSLTTLEIIQDKNQSRGLGGTNTVIINDLSLSDQEFIAVLVHELGHIIDLGGIQGSPAFPLSNFNDGPNPIYRNDRSTVFYGYSWLDSYQKKQTADRLDFVSGYAMTDPFEDFAESFVYYTLHNRTFKLLAQQNSILELKYNWIRDNVFGGEEPETGKMQVNSQVRVWDSTKLPVAI